MVELDGRDVLNLAVRRTALKIIDKPTCKRCGDQALDLQRNRIEAADGDHVTGENVAVNTTIGGIGEVGGRIVDGVFENGPAEPVGAEVATSQRLREVTVAVTRRGDCAEAEEVRRLVTEHFEVHEEKAAVAAIVELRDRDVATERGTKVMTANLGADQASATVVGEGATGVKLFVGEVVVERTVEVIGPGAGGEVEEPAAGLTKFS